MLTTLPPPIRRRNFRKRSPAQQAAIERSREARTVRSAGGGQEITSAMLGPQVESTAAAPPESARPKLSACTLCGNRFTSRERGHAVWFEYALAHESCLMAKFAWLDYSPAIIAAELAIRKRLAAELRGGTRYARRSK